MLAWPSKSTRNKNKAAQGIARRSTLKSDMENIGWMDETYSSSQQYSDVR